MVGVRAADRSVTNARVLGALEAGTTALLAMGGAWPRRTRLSIDGRWFGGTYGSPTAAGDQAMAAAEALGIALEPTYTAKAFAAALDRTRRGERVLFVQTFSGKTTGAAADGSPDPMRSTKLSQ